MNEKVIYNYLQGKTSPEEEHSLLDWIKQSPENKAFFFEIKALWNTNHVTVSEKELADSLIRLNKKIDRNESYPKKIKHRLYIWSSVAAIAALIILSYIVSPGFTEEKPEMIVYTNNTDTIQLLTLADGTTVWLKNNTTLSCPMSFVGQTREVLLEGEAFFDVAKGVHPFIVRTDVNLIKVIGTSFSVNTNIQGFIETILVTGIVHLQSIGENSVTVLHPGQSALYSKNNKSLEIRDVDPTMQTSWRYGLISLSEVSIHTIIQCIEDTYQVKLKMDTALLKNRHYNFSFNRAQGVKEALNQLTLITGISVESIQ